MTPRTLPVLFLALLSVGAPSARAEGEAQPTPRLVVPRVTWETLSPYVIARIVPTLQQREFSVSLCTSEVDQSTVSPWRPELADFAEVLMIQVMADNPQVAEAVHGLAEDFRARITTLTNADRARHRVVFWDLLLQDRQFTQPFAKELLRARRAGFLECHPCAEDPSYQPIGIIQDPCRDCPPQP